MESNLPALEDLFQSHCLLKNKPQPTTKFTDDHSGSGIARRGHRAGKFVSRRPNIYNNPRPPAYFGKQSNKKYPAFPQAKCLLVRKDNNKSLTTDATAPDAAEKSRSNSNDINVNAKCLLVRKDNNKSLTTDSAAEKSRSDTNDINSHAICLLIRKDNNESLMTDATAVGAAANSRSDTNYVKSNSVHSYSDSDPRFKNNVDSKSINSERNSNNKTSEKNNEHLIRSINDNCDSRESNCDVRRYSNNVSRKGNMNLINFNDGSFNSKNNNGRRWDSGDRKFNKSSSRNDFEPRWKKYSSTNSNNGSDANRSKSGPSGNNRQRFKSSIDCSWKSDSAQSNSNVTSCSHSDLLKSNTNSKQSTTEYPRNSTFKPRDYYNKYENGNRRTKSNNANWKTRNESIWNENFGTKQRSAPTKPTIWTYHHSCASFQTDEDQQQTFLYGSRRPRGTAYRPKCTTSIYSDESFELIDDVNPGDQFKPCGPPRRKPRMKK